MGNLLTGTPISASLSLGQFRTDPANERYSKDGYYGDGFVSSDWFTGKMNPLITFLDTKFRDINEDVGYNHRAVGGTIAGLVIVFLVLGYYLLQYIRARWSKRGKGNDLNIPIEIHEVPAPGARPLVVRQGGNANIV